MAIEDFGGSVLGQPIAMVAADTQNKPDASASIARQWYDQDHVDVIVDVPNSGVAFAVSDLTRERNRVFLDSGAGSSDLTGAKCSPNTIHWTYDTWALANGTGSAMVAGGAEHFVKWGPLVSPVEFEADALAQFALFDLAAAPFVENVLVVGKDSLDSQHYGALVEFGIVEERG